MPAQGFCLALTAGITPGDIRAIGFVNHGFVLIRICGNAGAPA